MARLISDGLQKSKSQHFTPLRYPGGKAKLATFVKRVLKANSLLDGEYVEPYAGGAAIALELLLHEYVSCVRINDVSRPVYSFWDSILKRTEEFCRLVRDTTLDVGEWDKQKLVLSKPNEHDDLQLGFAMFFLNRTNRSGILNGGIIGGRDQLGFWKIDARYNAKELISRIITIARLGERIKVTKQDALAFIKQGFIEWPRDTFVYLDPPYYVKGRNLYLDFYKEKDHQEMAKFLCSSVTRQQWMVSYDNVPEIMKMYSIFRHVSYDINYSARKASQGSETMFFSNNLKVPPLVGPVTLTSNSMGWTSLNGA